MQPALGINQACTLEYDSASGHVSAHEAASDFLAMDFLDNLLQTKHPQSLQASSLNPGEAALTPAAVKAPGREATSLTIILRKSIIRETN